jgi:hypothetical protein
MVLLDRTRIDPSGRYNQIGYIDIPTMGLHKVVSSGDGIESTCVDRVNLPDRDNPLWIRHDTEKCSLMSGETSYYGHKVLFTDCPTSWRPRPVTNTLGFTDDQLNDDLGSLAQYVAARTNPSRAHVSLPTFLGELRDWADLPRQLRSFLQGGLIRKAANANISYRFGIAPFVADLRKLLDFTAAVEKRLAELKRLQKDGYIRRRVLLGYRTGVPRVENKWLQTLYATVTARRTTTFTMERWATIRWNISDGYVLPSTDASRLAFARRLCAGINGFGALETAWELIPWSWLIDWFFGIGTYLKAYNNSVSCYPSNLCYMRTITSESTYVITGATKGLTVTPGLESQVTKERVILPTALVYLPTPRVPAFSAGQLSILGSLAVGKNKIRL